MAFNRDPDLLHKGQVHPVQRNMGDRKLALIFNTIFPGIRYYGHLLPGFLGMPYKATRSWAAYALKVLEEDRSGKGRASFMLRITETVDDFLGRKLNDSEVLEEVMGMMLAPIPLF